MGLLSSNIETLYDHPEVRRLAWAIASPPLWQDDHRYISMDWCHEQWALHRAWLDDLDRNPEPLKKFLAAKDHHRLGYYFERLLSFWWQESPRFELLGQNIQVNDGVRTLGEFDFLIRDLSGQQVYHFEVSVKFYLGFGQASEHDRWIGPNAKDRLADKLSKFSEHQVGLSENEHAKKKLATLGIEEVIPKIHFKGYFFHHRSALSQVWPKGASDHHLRGWWLYASEASVYLDKNKHWAILPKRDWLGGFQTLEQPLSTTKALQQIEREVQQQQFPLLLVELQEENEKWKEVSRGFIVPTNWPD